tara:strand:- start:860 stop:1354 length:495 start_codon:yes stop_codon:yes gene_type:complete
MSFEQAIINEDLENIHRYIKNGYVDINSPLSTGFPPISEVITPGLGLQFSIHKPNEKILKLLLDSGADVNKKGEYPGNTALIQASFFGFKKTVKLLLEYGASINAQNVEGATALMMATLESKVEIITLLLSKGADKNVKTFNMGMTALDGALRNNNQELIELLK